MSYDEYLDWQKSKKREIIGCNPAGAADGNEGSGNMIPRPGRCPKTSLIDYLGN
jgi:hypothetical protein